MNGKFSRRRALGWAAALAGAGVFGPAAAADSDVPQGFVPPEMKPIQVAAHTWYVQGQSALGSSRNQNFISNAGFVVTDDSVVVVDALGAPVLAQRLLELIAEITDKPVKTVILTHYHADHIYGAQVFQDAGARIIANELGREYLYSHTAQGRLEASREEMAPWINADTRLVEADEWMNGTRALSLGGMDFVVQSVGPAHTVEDVVVWVPAEKVLFSGDLVFANRVPYVGEADSRSWLQALDGIKTFDAKVIVPGHGDASYEPQKDIEITSRYLQYLRDSMAEAARELIPFDEAYAATDWSEFEGLPLFHEANRMNAYNTYLLMEDQVD
ncbi:MAG: MBL fold metallo-hydrolase [Ottowia sp.]